jgi:signal transduction histidine kinase
LLSNAIKYTPHGGNVEISVAANRNGDVEVRISDTGIGIATDQMPKLREAFGKFDGDLYLKYEGTGLGLPLAIALAKLHGGSITFDSRLGEGTTATLTLPRSRIVAAGESAPHASTPNNPTRR